MIGVGMDSSRDTRGASAGAAGAALAELAPGTAPAWALAFVGRRHDANVAAEALKAALGGIPVYGGACVGAAAGSAIGYAGTELAVAVFPDCLSMPQVFSVQGLAGRTREAGLELGAAMRGAVTRSDSVLLLYDLVRTDGPGLVPGSELLEGLHDALAAGQMPVVLGAGLVANFRFNQSFVLDGSGAGRDRVVALRMPRELGTAHCVLHGCAPMSAFHEITRAEGERIFELDGERAVDRLCQLLGIPDESGIAYSVLLGKRLGDPFAPPDAASYLSRMVIDADPKSGAVRLFERDLKAGDRVQLMARNGELILDLAARGAAELVDRVAGSAVRLALYLDCAGRAAAHSGSEGEDVAVVRSRLGALAPFLGLYVGRELAPLGGRSRPLDLTGVLVLFTERGARNGAAAGVSVLPRAV